MNNIMLVGDGMGKTIITGSKSVGGGSTTFNSATFAVTGDGFIARDITFRNTAGPQNHQAVALRVGSDLSVFYQCSIEGYQDTLYVHSQRQFFRQCNIYGIVDFIFGNAAVVLQNCNIYARKPMTSQKNTVTAQGRIDPNQDMGIVIHNSQILASLDLKPVTKNFPTYLGRPWKQYSRTVVMQTFLDGLINPAGWLEWDVATTEFIKTSCKATVYPDLCFNSLYTQANAIQTSPMLLANAALSVTLATARTTSAMVSQMSKDAGMRPREAGAMRDCLEVLRATVEELQQSITEMGDVKNSKNFGLQMNDIQTWVSAALTNEDTCTEGFGGKIMDGNLKTVMRGKIVNICHLTSNALALINSFASLHG
ncbi:hypothetical protein Cgig2_001778 [Carnegiea gigantea]|uniref:pectinesterase n=1 Tax=Carnegiea gigantea TaxID=171969 RepID=A0A9Q1GI39_9CARY|nr:hypothetical protein Cgig2_001778 [Carnegiea gigantea]